jgi:hypothetical protein
MTGPDPTAFDLDELAETLERVRPRYRDEVSQLRRRGAIDKPIVDVQLPGD